MASIQQLTGKLIRDRPEGYVDRQWIEQRIVTIVKAALHGRPAYARPGKNGASATIEPAIGRNHSLALSGLMQLARLKGYIVERKQSSIAKLDLSKLSPADLQQYLTASLSELDPAARRQIEAITMGEADTIEAE